MSLPPFFQKSSDILPKKKNDNRQLKTSTPELEQLLKAQATEREHHETFGNELLMSHPVVVFMFGQGWMEHDITRINSHYPLIFSWARGQRDAFSTVLSDGCKA